MLDAIKYLISFLQTKVSLEGDCDVSSVRSDSTKGFQSGNRARNGICVEESKDTKHGKTSVVSFSNDTTSFWLVCPLLAKTKGNGPPDLRVTSLLDELES